MSDYEREARQRQRLGLSCDPATHTRLLESCYHLAAYPEVPAALARLAVNRRVVILSNGTPQMLAEVTRVTGLTAVFDELISVEAVRVYKPNPRVYALLPQRLGMPTEAIGFVSSNAFDITGAKAFGLRTSGSTAKTPPRTAWAIHPMPSCVHWRNWRTGWLRSGRRLSRRRYRFTSLPCAARARAARG